MLSGGGGSFVTINTTCAECGKPLALRASMTGSVLPGDYVLVADWEFHLGCWAAVAERGEVTIKEDKHD